MEFQEQSPVLSDVQKLEHIGLSSEQIAALLRIKTLYQQGAFHKDTSEQKRQEFIRWLYLQGRLHS